MNGSPYVVDTCALTWAFREAYPFEVAPAFWKNLQNGIESGRIISSVMVMKEIQRKDDDLHEWCKTVPSFFSDMTQEILNKAKDVVQTCPTMINPFSEKDGADPFLIAMAWASNGTVVTQEQSASGRKKLKIPDVCDRLKIKCVPVLQMMKELQWRLG